MDTSKIEQIINEYAAVLKKAANIGCKAMPISELPYPKQEIKDAIKLYLAVLHKTGKLPEEVKSALEVAFISLGAFIDDNDAKMVIETNKWVEQMELINFKDTKKLQEHIKSYDAGNNIAKTREIEEKISKEMNDLELEIEKLLKDIKYHKKAISH